MISLSTFRVDVTPPIGSPLCGGWIAPVAGVTDPLYALGVVLLGDDAPVVLCALDWCEIRNEDHALWRERLGKAVGTGAERVAVQTVHQHNAPLTDLAAQRLVREQGMADLMDAGWAEGVVERVAEAAQKGLKEAQPVTHAGMGQARVAQVASNRRVLGPDGKVNGVRWSACQDAALRAAPEGLIDPMLRTISFWNGKQKLAALHTYATHPMSTYGDGLVNSDFAGQARERRTGEDGGALHLYFTGCAGDVTAGKYNDGAPENRAALAERLHAGMVASERQAERFPVDRLDWRVAPVTLPPREDLNEAALMKALANISDSEAKRKGAALYLAYLRRMGTPIPFTALHLGGKACLLHLPGEPLIEYQLYAQEQRPGGFVAVAGYGDCGTGYIPLAKHYAEGGYEPTAASVSPEAEEIMKRAIQGLVRA